MGKERSVLARLMVVLLVTLVAAFTVGAAVAQENPPGCKNPVPGDPGNQNPNCTTSTPAPECSDGIDNDADGATDFPFDRDCASADGFHESGSDEPECSDGVDNDGDGGTDFGGSTPDADCTDDDDDKEASDRLPECSDGIDNDKDGATDGFDRDCTGPDDDTESGSDEPECSDGVDNDADGATDFGEHGDPDCTDDDDDTESGQTLPQCSDGEDNDGDGLVDAEDPGCESPDDDDETDGPAPTCDDPDGDGTDHSAFDPDSNEGGLVSGIVHEVDQALPGPLGGDQGVVTEVNCALVVTVEEILGVNG